MNVLCLIIYVYDDVKHVIYVSDKCIVFYIYVLCFRYMYYVLDLCIVFCTYGPP